MQRHYDFNFGQMLGGRELSENIGYTSTERPIWPKDFLILKINDVDFIASYEMERCAYLYYSRIGYRVRGASVARSATSDQCQVDHLL